MAYIGNQPTEAFTTFATQTFSTSATSSYTLDHAVTNENEIALFVNNVRQQPGSGKAYTATGTALTLSANTASTDTMYCVFLGRALQTVNPPDGSVATAKIAATAVTGAKLNTDVISAQTALASEPADTDEFLVSDAGVLKRIDYSLIKGGGMWEFVSSTNVTSATAAVEFVDNLSTDFIDFCVVIENAHPATDEARMYVRVYTGGGTGTLHDGSVYHYAEIMRDNATVTDDATGADHMRVSNQIGSAATESMCSEVVIFNPHSTTYHKLIKAHTAIQGSDTGRTGIDNWAGKYAATTAITGLRFFMQSGNIEAGRFSLYGRKHS